MFILEQYPMIL